MLNQQFNGIRLREGRLYRGTTITDLAEELSITKQMISKYENNKAIPPFDTVQKISEFLKFPFQYFYEDTIKVNSGSTFFRSLLTTGKKEREMQYDRAKYLTIIRVLLEEYVDFPNLDIEQFQSSNEDDIEEITKRLRDYWSLGNEPISNLVLLLETRGFTVSSLALEKANIDAFGTQYIVNDKVYETIVLGSDKQSFYRRQFDLAHELGHKILHDSNLDLTSISKEEFREIENEAHDFAACFLLPRDGFGRDVSIYPTDLEYYKVLKKKWNVSIGAMVMRAYKLNIIGASTYQYLQRQISVKKWRTKEPFDDVKEMATPVGMKQAIELLIENEHITAKDFLKELSDKYHLSLHHAEVEQLLGLDKNYLKPETPEFSDNVVSINDLKSKKDN